MFVSYVLWLLLSRLTTPDIIGISSTVISLAMIFSVIVDLGVSRGSTFHLGKSFSIGQSGDTTLFIKASLVILCLSISVFSLVSLIFKEWLYPNLPFELVFISLLLVGISAISNLLRSVLIASLQTEILPRIMIISSVCKIILAIILVLLGTGAIGITIGYLASYLSAVIPLFFALTTILKPIKQKSAVPLYRACNLLLYTGLAWWVPRVTAVMGARLGTIIVFGIEGAGPSGVLFYSFFHFLCNCCL